MHTAILLMALAAEPSPSPPGEVKECIGLSLDFGLGGLDLRLGRRAPLFAPRFPYPRPYARPYLDQRILRLLLLQQYLRERERRYWDY